MQIAVFVFDKITALDAVGPLEILSRLPDADIRIVGKRAGPVRADRGSGQLGLIADHAMADVPDPDILLIPGARDMGPVIADEAVLDWVRAAHETTRWTVSVCTGALVLAAAGLLRGRRATTHWSARPRLADYGAVPLAERVVTDGKIMTGAGVSAGIDLALTLSAELAGEDHARFVQLMTEYDPHPPFQGGTPDTTPEPIRKRAFDLLGL